jgi:hypothetical protein
MLIFCFKSRRQLVKKCNKEIPSFDKRMIRFELFLNFSALVEKIVSVLPRMKCPHGIEPHQIQGLDFIHVYPVIQVTYELIFFSHH